MRFDAICRANLLRELRSNLDRLHLKLQPFVIQFVQSVLLVMYSVYIFYESIFASFAHGSPPTKLRLKYNNTVYYTLVYCTG